jgi:hypothetical protein
MQVSGQPHAPTALFQGKETQVSIELDGGGPQSMFACFGDEKNTFALPGFEPQIIQSKA